MTQTRVDRAGAASGSLKSYTAGFVLSIVLTAIAFALATSGQASRSAAVFGIFAAAVLQILVHLYCFLHLDGSSDARWNTLALLFTLLIMVLFVAGTLWIMHSLGYRMM